MASYVIGYPQESNYCPKCGSSIITCNDSWNQNGLLICKDCDCRCYVIQADDKYAKLFDKMICTLYTEIAKHFAVRGGLSVQELKTRLGSFK